MNKYIYGSELEIYFEKRIRSEKRFNSIALLRKQILKDAEQANHLLSVGSLSRCPLLIAHDLSPQGLKD
jgi:hypothetical protein